MSTGDVTKADCGWLNATPLGWKSCISQSQSRSYISHCYIGCGHFIISQNKADHGGFKGKVLVVLAPALFPLPFLVTNRSDHSMFQEERAILLVSDLIMKVLYSKTIVVSDNVQFIPLTEILHSHLCREMSGTYISCTTFKMLVTL